MLNTQVMGFPPGKIVIFCPQSSAIFLTVSFTSRDQRKYLKIGFVLSNKSFEILVWGLAVYLRDFQNYRQLGHVLNLTLDVLEILFCRQL